VGRDYLLKHVKAEGDALRCLDVLDYESYYLYHTWQCVEGIDLRKVVSYESIVGKLSGKNVGSVDSLYEEFAKFYKNPKFCDNLSSASNKASCVKGAS
jgi:hypothetical protein